MLASDELRADALKIVEAGYAAVDTGGIVHYPNTL